MTSRIQNPVVAVRTMSNLQFGRRPDLDVLDVALARTRAGLACAAVFMRPPHAANRSALGGPERH